MERVQQITQQPETNLELARMFQVEELEEKVEFGKWSAEVKGGVTYDPSTGETSGTIKGGVSFSL